MCGEDINILESFTYLGSVVHNNGRLTWRMVLWTRLARTLGVVQTDKDSDLQVADDPCLTVWLRDIYTEH